MNSQTVAACFLALALAQAAAQSRAASGYLSPSELNRNSAIYDRELVEVRGWIHYRFNIRELWDSQEDSRRDARGRLNPDCITLDISPAVRTQVELLDGKYVLIRGLFLEEVAGRDGFLGGCHRTGIRIIDIRAAN